jgi:hypothetical protein
MTSDSMRRGRRVSLAARYPDRDPAMPQFISNHGLRMVEASLRAAALPPHGAPAPSAAPRLDGLELAVWDGNGGTPASLAEAIIARHPIIPYPT